MSEAELIKRIAKLEREHERLTRFRPRPGSPQASRLDAIRKEHADLCRQTHDKKGES